MKRQAAIVGPTPAMIRWTLLRDCGLRDLEKLPPAESAARQLGGLVEWSRANRQNRFQNGICWHENCDQVDLQIDTNQSWLGFPEHEPFNAFGPRQDVIDICLACPANTERENDGIAGCWGTIPFHAGNGPFSTSGDNWFRLTTGLKMQVVDLPVWLTENLDASGRATVAGLFPRTEPAWYGLFCLPEWNPSQVAWVGAFFEKNADRLPTPELCKFVAAVRLAQASELRICFQSLPPGHSDGHTWTLRSHCGKCGHVRQGRLACECCSEHRAPMPEHKRKVLGLRPWLRLADLLGAQAAATGVNHWRKYRQAKIEN